jgi:hypothetical protein
VPAGAEARASELVAGFSLEKLPRERVVFGEADDVRLRAE